MADEDDDEAAHFAEAGFAGVRNSQLIIGQEVTQATADMIAELNRVADTYRNLGLEQRAGHLFEVMQAGTFNINAAAGARFDLNALTTASMGVPTARADILINAAGQPVSAAQLKLCGNVPQTTFSVADARYDGMQRVVASDQAAGVRDLAARRGNDGLGVRNYPQTADTASGTMHYDGVASRPTTREEMLNVARNPQAAARNVFLRESAKVVGRSAVWGGAAGGGISLIQNGIAIYRGQLDTSEAGKRVAIATTKSAGNAAATTALSIGLRQATLRTLPRLARGSTPIVMAAGLIESALDVRRCFSGEISGGELAVRCAGHGGGAVGSIGAAKAGAALGTAICPGIGTVVGLVAGGIVGHLGGSWLMRKLFG